MQPIKMTFLMAILLMIGFYQPHGYGKNLEDFLEASKEELTKEDLEHIGQLVEKTSPDKLMNMLLDSPRHFSLRRLLAKNWDFLSRKEQSKMQLITGQMKFDQYLKAFSHRPQIADSFIARAIARSIWGTWDKVEIPGAYCSDGSPYKIFVSDAVGYFNKAKENHKKLLVYMEPGGACFDYESCLGKNGMRGAVNTKGIPDNYMNLGAFLSKNKKGGSPMAAASPLILYNNPSGYHTKTSRWNRVFMPYCTGDVHMGNKVAVYKDPKGEGPDLTYRHFGAINVEKSIAYLKERYQKPKEMMITGCSAGGTGALGNYHFFRRELQPEKSALLADSGPIFPAPGRGNQYPLQKKIKQAWGLSYVIDRLTSDFDDLIYTSDFGIINKELAKKYPQDIIAATLFKRDLKFSTYSYADFYDLDDKNPRDKERILKLWAEDIENLTAQYDTMENLVYYIPYMRNIFDSHCTTLLTYAGTEVQKSGVKLDDFINDILEGNRVLSYEEPKNPDDRKTKDLLSWLIQKFFKYDP